MLKRYIGARWYVAIMVEPQTSDFEQDLLRAWSSQRGLVVLEPSCYRTYYSHGGDTDHDVLIGGTPDLREAAVAAEEMTRMLLAVRSTIKGGAA